MKRERAIQDRVIAVVSEKVDLPVTEIDANCYISHDLGADSLEEVEIVMALEEEFDIEIHDEDAEKSKVISEIVSLIERIMANK